MRERDIERMLAIMPVEYRITALVLSVIEANGEAMNVSRRMAELTVQISRDLSHERRFVVANWLRDGADALEHNVKRITIR